MSATIIIVIVSGNIKISSSQEKWPDSAIRQRDRSSRGSHMVAEMSNDSQKAHLSSINFISLLQVSMRCCFSVVLLFM